MGEHVYYLGIGKPSLNTTEFKAIKERTNTFGQNKEPLYNPRNHH